MYTDTHIHSAFSGDSDTPPRSQIEKALSLRMKCLCFTDHHDYDVKSDIDFNLDFENYFKQLGELKEQYSGKIELLIGMELGLQPHIAAYNKELCSKYGFDYVIGSVHFIDGLDPYYPEYFQLHPYNAYERFFETTLECIKGCDFCDSLGHLDYIIRYGTPLGLPYSYKAFGGYIDEILRTVINKGIALECNTGGMAKGLPEPNPGAEIFKRYRQLGGELVTIGSDAHSPETMGYKFDLCGQMLKDIGFKHYAVFKNRSPEMYTL